MSTRQLFFWSRKPARWKKFGTPDVVYDNPPIIGGITLPWSAPSTVDTTVEPPAAEVAGSAAVGTTAYAYPPEAVWIDPTTGVDAATGRGSAAAPYRTVAYALTKVGNGATLVMKGGIYHERFETPSGLSNITIQSAPNEEAWFDGSSIKTGWVDNGNATWTAPYTVVWPRFTSELYAGLDAQRGKVDQLIVDGDWYAVTQIADNTVPGPGQFSVNQAASTITVRLADSSNPNSHVMRVSDLSTGIIAAKGTYRGFGVRRFSPKHTENGSGNFQAETGQVGYNGSFYVAGAATDSVFENLYVKESAMAGFAFTKRCTIRNVTVQDCGQAGIHGTTSDGMVLENVEVRRFNRGLWQAEPIAAGIKITRTDGIELRHIRIEDGPRAYGIWLDVNCTRYVITNPKIIGNTGLAAANPMQRGIETELSDGGNFAGTQHYGLIVNPRITGCRVGIMQFDSGYSKIFNFDVRGNDLGIYLWQDNRTHNDGYRTATEAPWISRGHLVCNGILENPPTPVGGTGTLAQFLAYDNADGGVPQMLGGDMFDRVAGCWFHGAPPGSMAQIGKVDGSRTSKNTPAALASPDAAVGLPAGVVEVKVGTNYQGTTPPASSIADPMPADVAAELSVPAGSQAVGPVLPEPVSAS